MVDVWLMRFWGLFGKGMRVIDRQVIRTAYGVGWKGRTLSADMVCSEAAKAGFALVEREERGGSFRLRLAR